QRQDHAEEDAELAHAIAARRILQFAGDLAHELGQDHHRQRQPLCGIDQHQRGARIDEIQRHHQLQDGDRAQPDRDHDADGDEEIERAVAEETVLGQRPGRHGAEQHNQEKRRHCDRQAVAEVEQEVRAGQHLLEAGEGQRLGSGQGHRAFEDGVAGLDRIDEDERNRKQRDHCIQAQHRMHPEMAGLAEAALDQRRFAHDGGGSGRSREGRRGQHVVLPPLTWHSASSAAAPGRSRRPRRPGSPGT
ncbi:conserved hypothetical protein, partial [Ricinus communis]